MADKNVEKTETYDWRGDADAARNAVRIFKALENADRVISSARAADAERVKLEAECDRLNKKIVTLNETYEQADREARAKSDKRREAHEREHQALVDSIAEKKAMHTELVGRIDAATNEHARAIQDRRAEIASLDTEKRNLERGILSLREGLPKVAAVEA